MKDPVILAIESSCDDTSAAVIRGNTILSNIAAAQQIHLEYGGVVPELASRAHLQHIVPVVQQALTKAKIQQNDIQAVGFTRGPGLLGSLLVGVNFAKSFAQARGLPLIEVNHLQAHILAHFIEDTNNTPPPFPFLCLTVSGGHTMIVLVRDYFDMVVVGRSIDDAAGEAFDKIGKLFGLPYPAGPEIDKISKDGDADAFSFSKPRLAGFDYSFSGLKTSVLYYIQKQVAADAAFVNGNLADLCAAVQRTIVEILMEKLTLAADHFKIKHIAIAGGVSANSSLREKILSTAGQKDWQVYIPKFEYTTDNAAMIAMVAKLKLERGEVAPLDITADARYQVMADFKTNEA